MKPVRHALCHKNSEIGTVGKADEIDFFLMQSHAELIDQFDCILDFAADAEIRRRYAGCVRFAGAATIPLDDNKIAFKVVLKIVGEVHRRHSRPAMEKQKNRVLFVFAANENVLPPATEPDLLQ